MLNYSCLNKKYFQLKNGRFLTGVRGGLILSLPLLLVTISTTEPLYNKTPDLLHPRLGPPGNDGLPGKPGESGPKGSSGNDGNPVRGRYYKQLVGTGKAA